MSILKRAAIPDGWCQKPLRSWLSRLEAGKSVNSVDSPVVGDEVGVLKTSAASPGKFQPTKNKRVVDGEMGSVACPVRGGSVLISRMNTAALVGAACYVSKDFPNLYLPDRLWQTVGKRQNAIDGQWLAYVLNTSEVRAWFERIATGTSGSMKNITKDDVLNLRPLTPPFDEQRTMSGILWAWDEGLEKMDALIAAKKRHQRALMQQLLTGTKRLQGYGGEWKTVDLGVLIRPNLRPVAKPPKPFLSAGIRSHNRGVFLKPDFKPADIALDELFELKAGDLVVNITFAWEGAVAIVPAEADGALVSHRFPTFEFVPGKSDVGFFRQLIRTKRFVFHCGLASPGGAGRNRVLSKTEFLKIPVSVPPIEEQTAIGEVLDTCDEELRLLRSQRDAFDRQKRGLMQRLLTGKLRVKPEKEDANG